MPTMKEKLETLFDKVRALPEPRQQVALDALSDITEEPYQISEEELAILYPAFERAERGEFASDASTSDILTKSWR